MEYSHAYCSKCGPISEKLDKCPVCGGWITWVYIYPKKERR